MPLKRSYQLFSGAALLLQLFLAGLIALAYSYNISGVEHNVLYTIQRTLNNPTDLFINPSDVPYAVTQYSPMYYILCDWTNRILGWEMGVNAHEIQVTARFMSILAFVISLVFIRKIAMNIFQIDSWMTSTIVVLSILATAPWYYLCRIDAFLFLFDFAAFYFSFRYFSKEDRNHQILILVGILCLFSIFSKQSGMITPTLIGGFLFFKKEIEGFVRFKLGLFLGLLLAGLMIWPYYSPFLIDNIFGGVANNGFSLKNALYPLNRYLTGYAFIGVLAVLLGSLVYQEKGSLRKIATNIQFLMFVFIGNTAFALITSFKYGSDLNYYHNSIVLSLILCPLLVGKLKKGPAFLRDHRVKKVFLALFVFVVIVSSYQVFNKNVANRPQNYLAGKWAMEDEMIHFVSSELGPNHFFISFNPALNNRLPLKCIFPHQSITKLPAVLASMDLTAYKKAFKKDQISLLVAEKKINGYMGEEWTALKLLRTFGNWNVYKIER